MEDETKKQDGEVPENSQPASRRKSLIYDPEKNEFRWSDKPFDDEPVTSMIEEA